ncbi:MAG: undecaprenyl/decaprenyl-phosphate alpha-N-acetylglucosaminyl 1-phosphate transferase [candidate division NC10 bacterium]|nr:undecaprenyl/decaprenyl-phosphate alpha-N-acetylglucosaminyl 1-phosphate transferase [candidate division NC10 bacterium]
MNQTARESILGTSASVSRNGIPWWSWWMSLLVLGLAGFLLLPVPRTTWHTVYGARWAYILVVSSLIAFGLTPILIRLAYFLEVVDLPVGRKVHLEPTPLLGGVAIYTAFGISILANSILDGQVLAIMVGGTLLVVVGILDDVRSVPAGVKLLGQLLAAAAVMQTGVVLTLFPQSVAGTVANAALTLLWLLGITNAMNFFDGMDGLATGLSIITAGLLGFFAALTFQPFLGWFAAAIVGSCLGFLPFNFRPKRPAAIFLGDSGSPFLGFVLAALAVKGEWASDNIIDIGVPVLIFWVFIFDMTHITLTRILTGKVRSFREWIAYVGRDHLHHRLEALLGSKRQTVLLIYLLSVSMGLAALALRNARTLEAVLLTLQAAIIVVIVSILERAGNR